MRTVNGRRALSPTAGRPISLSVRGFAAMPETGWWRFGAWVVAGAFALFAWTTGFPVGLVLLPVAVLLVWLAGRGGRAWPGMLGLAGGAGVFGLVIAIMHRDYRECPVFLPPGETTLECGGIDPKPWLVGGLALAAIAPLLHAVARRRIEKAP
jgi:hypothetical protein